MHLTQEEKSMDSDKANQLSNEFASMLSEVLPDLRQLLQSYQISETFEIDLFDLGTASRSIKGSCLCNGIFQNPCRCSRSVDISEAEFDSEEARQFCAEVDAKLSAILPRLRQSAEQLDGSFDVHFLIDPAPTSEGKPMVCQWIDDPSEGLILQCSKP
jgi:hypothetical protein